MIRFISMLALGSSLASSLGCNAPSPTAEVEAVEGPSEQAPTEPTSEGEPSAPTKAANEVNGQLLVQRLQQAANVMQAMRDASIEAETGGESECEKAFLGITAAVRVSVEQTSALGHSAPNWEIAPRAEYLRLCGGLPEPIQRCSRFAYRMQNSDECTPVMEAVDPATREVLNRMAARVARPSKRTPTQE